MGAHKPLLGAVAVAFAAVSLCPLARSQVQQAPAFGPPITFRDNGQQVDRLAPTPPYAQLATGLYGRQIVQTPSRDGDYTVQVWSLLVSPKTTTGETRLPGAAVLMLLTGRVEVVAGGQRGELMPGTTTTVPENGVLRIANAGEQPVQMRAVILIGAR